MSRITTTLCLSTNTPLCSLSSNANGMCVTTDWAMSLSIHSRVRVFYFYRKILIDMEIQFSTRPDSGHYIVLTQSSTHVFTFIYVQWRETRATIVCPDMCAMCMCTKRQWTIQTHALLVYINSNEFIVLIWSVTSHVLFALVAHHTNEKTKITQNNKWVNSRKKKRNDVCARKMTNDAAQIYDDGFYWTLQNSNKFLTH